MALKTMKITEETHKELTRFLASLMSQTGERQTFDAAIMILMRSSVQLPEGLMVRVSEAVKKSKGLYTNENEFIVEAVRRRINDLEGISEYVPIPREDYEEAYEALQEGNLPYKTPDEFLQEKLNNCSKNTENGKKREKKRKENPTYAEDKNLFE